MALQTVNNLCRVQKKYRTLEESRRNFPTRRRLRGREARVREAGVGERHEARVQVLVRVGATPEPVLLMNFQ